MNICRDKYIKKIFLICISILVIVCILFILYTTYILNDGNDNTINQDEIKELVATIDSELNTELSSEKKVNSILASIINEVNNNEIDAKELFRVFNNYQKKAIDDIMEVYYNNQDIQKEISNIKVLYLLEVVFTDYYDSNYEIEKAEYNGEIIKVTTNKDIIEYSISNIDIGGNTRKDPKKFKGANFAEWKNLLEDVMENEYDGYTRGSLTNIINKLVDEYNEEYVIAEIYTFFSGHSYEDDMYLDGKTIAEILIAFDLKVMDFKEIDKLSAMKQKEFIAQLTRNQEERDTDPFKYWLNEDIEYPQGSEKYTSRKLALDNIQSEINMAIYFERRRK